MKNLKSEFRKRIVECVHKRHLTETYEESLDEKSLALEYEILQDLKAQKKITFELINPIQYHNALKEFMKFGKFMRFPAKYIFEWKDLMLTNVVKLDVLNQIGGHASHWPVDEFNDIFDDDGSFTKWMNKMNKKLGSNEYKHNDWTTMNDYLDQVYHMDDYLPLFSNGQWVVSDFGIGPLVKLAYELDEQNDPNEIVVTINRMLDVVHPRSDLAELFIEGGSKSLTYISNS